MEPSSRHGPSRSVWDTVRAVLVVLFAFLAASFPAVNSDVWQHLATGRALFDGSYTFGTDPFAYTTTDTIWINHAWLFDALAYGLHQGFGGAALAVVKALLIAILAGSWLRLCWHEPRRWLATLLIVVSLVALSPYVLLRPVCVSFLLLGVTAFWLERHPSPASWRAVVPLLFVFVLWANFDEWFLLGPLAVLVWWLGGMVRRKSPTDNAPTDRRVSLGWVAAVGLALALLNPHHVRVFTVPELLDPTVEAEWFDAAHDREARRSPLAWNASGGIAFGGIGSEGSLRQPGRLAYGALVLVGIISFIVRRDGLPVGRLLIWALFLALSVYRSGAIPFFAVVAGPIAALNLQEWLAARASTNASPPRAAFMSEALRFASVPLLAGAVLAAWTGWIREFPGEPRRWRLALDPSLEAAARQFADWHRQHKVSAAARGLPTSSAAAHVLAWLSPAEKSFCEDRPHLFSPEIRGDFAALRQSLFLPDDKSAAARWRELLDKHGITHLLVDHADERELQVGLGRLFSSPMWTLHHLYGGAVVFAKRDQAALLAPAVDPWERAYRPSAEELAPAAGPGRDPTPRSWLDALDRPSLPDGPGRKECLVWQAHFDAQRGAYGRRMRLEWEHGLAASVVGLIAAEARPPGLAPGAILRWACLSYSREAKAPGDTSALYDVAFQVFRRFVGMRDDGPPGSLFAAIRAGRRAVQANPDDARSHLYLADAYLRLRRQTRERTWAPAFLPLEHLRRTQALVALRDAARLEPGLEVAHELLWGLYDEIGYQDLALEHVRLLVERLEARARAAEQLTAAKQRLEYWRHVEKLLARQVRDAQLALRAEDLDALGKARRALAHDLPGQALAALDTDVSSIGREGMRLKLGLMLHTGQTREVRELLQTILEAPGDQSDFRWLHVYLSAATGDYAGADRDLETLSDVAVHSGIAIGKTLGLYLLERAARVPIGYPFEMIVRRDEFTQVPRIAEIAALRGLLALEVGNMDLARQQLRRSRQWFEAGAAARLARDYLELIEKK